MMHAVRWSQFDQCLSLILKNFSVLFQHETASKIILKNFSINIHEAVLHAIAAFVYYNPRQQQAVASTQKSEISTRRRRLRN